ncbi:MAG: primosomal protein N' [Clostridia bacterium]|nr:primosomal protein N' [Clostridia bacterium]
MENVYAEVHVLGVPGQADRRYTYFVPAALREEMRPGLFVRVPFGGGNRDRIALTVALTEDYTGTIELKPVLAVCDDCVSLDAELLGLCLFMKEQTLCTVGDAVHAMIPAAALGKFVRRFRAVAGAAVPEDAAGRLIWDAVSAKGSMTYDSLRARFGGQVTDALNRLTRAGILLCETELKEPADRRASLWRLAPALAGKSAEEIFAGAKLRSAGQKAIVAELCAGGGREEEELLNAAAASRTQLKALAGRGMIVEERVDLWQNLPAAPTKDPRGNRLSPAQQAAFDTLSALYRRGEASAALLHGVTGSGKTRVMLSMIDEVLRDGRQVILLLPEIALTPQSVAIFCAYYGARVAVIHSGLSAGERLDTYRRIRAGEADLVIGTRSAVFAPLPNLGMIILDEEQEHTYKSDNDPKYHARDIARYRCAEKKALLLLASATPSLESYRKAKEGVYTLVPLTERYGGAVLPDVTVADMRQEMREGNIGPIGRTLDAALAETLAAGEQAILFLNRRGYHTGLSCRSCGGNVTCPNCSVSMTYHKHERHPKGGYLVCHWCGARMDVPEECPACGSSHLSFMGYGTQQLEEELSRRYPGARILRMDTDTTSTKLAHETLLGRFRAGEADILLGTQMVTKGHDFPNVTLVGVLLADMSLYVDDYRAAERTFSLLTQVIGRAGRAEKRGRAVIQTNNPDHEVIRLACAQDYPAFYAREERLRRALVFPPFCDVVLLTLTSSDEQALMLATDLLRRGLPKIAERQFSDVAYVAFGPFEAPVYRVEGRYRMRMVLKCKLNRRSRAMFAEVYSRFSAKAPAKTVLTVDYNPTNL